MLLQLDVCGPHHISFILVFFWTDTSPDSLDPTLWTMEHGEVPIYWGDPHAAYQEVDSENGMPYLKTTCLQKARW